MFIIMLVLLGIGCELYAFRSKIFKGSEKKMSRPVLVIALVIMFVGIGWTVSNGWTTYEIGRDTTAYLNRAQVSSNPDDMHGYLVQCRDGMEEWELTDGYAALIFKTPENDMILVMQALDRSIERCEDIQTMDEMSPEYQTALDDVRGQIRELDIQASARYWTINWIVLLLSMLMLIGGILLAVFSPIFDDNW